MSRDTESARATRQAEFDAPATQLVPDRDTYLGQGHHDIGRRIADDQVELFISGDVASALQGEFQQHASEFIALHDVGTRASLRLLGSLASASAAQVQRLTVRRHGHGIALAALQFVEVSLSDGSRLRVYSTDIEADSHARHLMAPLLLAWSRLGVLLVGELPPHAMSSALAPVHEALARGPWPNRELLLVPVGASTALAARGAWLAGQSGVEVHATPSAPQPKLAWSHISGAWNRSHGQGPEPRSLQTVLERAVPRPPVPRSEAPTEPMDLEPSPGRDELAEAAASSAVEAETSAREALTWQAYADRCSRLKGLVACCVFHIPTQRPLAHHGNATTALRLAQEGTSLLGQMHSSSRALGLDGDHPDAAISTRSHHQLLRHVGGSVAVHLVLRADETTPAKARAELDRIAPPG